MKKFIIRLCFICAIQIQAVHAQNNYQDWIQKSLNADASQLIEKKAWLIGDKKKIINDILQHPYHQLRTSYWQNKSNPKQTLWILQEVGKEKFIDVGILIDDQKIKQLKILAFRESRGWEVKLPFFTEQFDNNSLTNDKQLTNQVDSISGATLSWRAVTKLARMALYLDQNR